MQIADSFRVSLPRVFCAHSVQGGRGNGFDKNKSFFAQEIVEGNFSEDEVQDRGACSKFSLVPWTTARSLLLGSRLLHGENGRCQTQVALFAW